MIQLIILRSISSGRRILVMMSFIVVGRTVLIHPHQMMNYLIQRKTGIRLLRAPPRVSTIKITG